MGKSVLVLLAFSATIGVFGQNGENFYHPCNNDFVRVYDFPNNDNAWNGAITLATNLQQSDIRVDIKLTGPAEVTLPDNDGEVVSQGNTFHLVYPQTAEARTMVRFHVVGASNAFPYINRLNVNGVNVCKNGKRWKHDDDARGKPNQGKPGNKPGKGQGQGQGQGQRPGHGQGQGQKPGQGQGQGNKKPTGGPTPAPTITTTAVPVTPSSTVASRIGGVAQCGRRLINHQGLITNGYPSQEGEWPWHTAIYHYDTRTSSSYKCGGTLISQDTVLTAAHCIVDGVGYLVPTRVFVKVGLHNRLVSSRNTQEIPVFSIIPHENFDMNDLKNDVALLKLSNEVTFSNYVQPVCLWPAAEADLGNVVGKNGLVIGWGLNEEDSLTDILTQGQMPVVSLTTCLESNRDFFGLFLSDNNYCAGFRNGTSVCNGDSGGGMFFRKDNLSWYIRGVVSLSVSREDKDVCNPRQFVIFTDVAKYLTWVNKYLN